MSFIRRTKEQSFEEVKNLVDAFSRNRRYYKSDDYLESNVRNEFIDKFLVALNWDVNNEDEIAPRYREVILEVRTKESGVVKHPDYALCVGGNPALFVEAKPPSEKILNADESCLQLRRYAYSAKRPISVLTNFEEFSVYDTRKSPKDGDSADKARIKYLSCEQYLEEFDYIWEVFSRDAVLKGSIETYFDKTDGNYERNDIDDEILLAVDQWRRLLISGAKERDWVLTEKNINSAVQKLINKFVQIWRKKGF